MIPSHRWFPTTIQERAAWCANFRENFPTVSVSLGLNSYDGQVQNDTQDYEYLAEIFNQIKAFERAMGEYRRILTEGDVGDTKPQFPPMPNFVIPKGVETGIFERFDRLRTKIMAADNYTDETGALLLILTKQDDSLSAADVKPTAKLTAAKTGYMFSAVVSNRGEADSWDVLVRREGETKWRVAKTATGKSVDVTFEPAVDGKPEQLQVMIQLKKNNQNYGESSDIIPVTVSP